ncbi:hypothetical protein F330043N2_27080 [Thomasclavelia ramosa]
MNKNRSAIKADLFCLSVILQINKTYYIIEIIEGGIKYECCY